MVAELLVRKYKNMNFKIPTYFSIVFKSGRNSGSISLSDRPLPERDPKTNITTFPKLKLGAFMVLVVSTANSSTLSKLRRKSTLGCVPFIK